MKRVLITGANGFTGDVLIKTLEGSGMEIIPLCQWEKGLKDEVVIDFCSDLRANSGL
ncbi:unnamed protein product, partial [marine sediment metagenome]